MPSLFARLREAARPRGGRAVVPLDVQRAFDAQCDARLDRHGKIVEGALLFFNLLWWPFDWVVFAPFPWKAWALIPARLFHTTVALTYLLLPRRGPVKRAIFWILAAAACGETAVASDAAALLGGPENPYFNTIYMVMLVTIVLPLSLRRRVGLTVALALSVVIGLLPRHAAFLASPHFPFILSFLTFSILVSAWLGNNQFALERENFFQAHQLAEHARLLETRVAERTEDLRSLLEHVETAREAERSRIARELHDELGQELSALRYSLGFTRVRYGRDPAAISANLDDLEELVKRTAQTTRNLVTDLRPRVLDDLGLGAAVEWLARRVEQRSDLRCRLSATGELSSLDERVATTAFRVLQEALTNVVRHAGAKEVEVAIAAKEGHVELRVTDDGIGVEAGRARRDDTSSGVGLLGMRERVLAIGGSLTISDRRPERGTEIRCRLPLHPVSARGDKRRAPSSGRATASAGALS